MSRLSEILHNHENLNQLFSILKHYGVNAEFVSQTLLQQFENGGEEDQDENSELQNATELIEDLKQFSARF